MAILPGSLKKKQKKPLELIKENKGYTITPGEAPFTANTGTDRHLVEETNIYIDETFI